MNESNMKHKMAYRRLVLAKKKAHSEALAYVAPQLGEFFKPQANFVHAVGYLQAALEKAKADYEKAMEIADKEFDSVIA
jgi:hypothetical protein